MIAVLWLVKNKNKNILFFFNNIMSASIQESLLTKCECVNTGGRGRLYFCFSALWMNPNSLECLCMFEVCSHAVFNGQHWGTNASSWSNIPSLYCSGGSRGTTQPIKFAFLLSSAATAATWVRPTKTRRETREKEVSQRKSQFKQRTLEMRKVGSENKAFNP